MKSNSAIKTRHIATATLLRLFMLLVTVITLYPLFWNIYSSFKTNTEFLENPFSLPSGLAVDNYVRAFEKSNLANNLFNSVFVVALTVVILLICVIPCAYVLARYKFLGSRLILNVFMAAIFIQAIYIIIPLFLQFNSLGWLNKLAPLALLYAIMQFPFSIFLLTGFMRTIPRDYEEAAMIDGSSNFGVLRHIIVPMSKPGIVTVCMLAAMGAWNEYAVALVMLTDGKKQTLPVGLANLYEVQRYATDWGALFAALVMVLIPTLILYAIGQKYLIQGINVGGLKG